MWEKLHGQNSIIYGTTTFWCVTCVSSYAFVCTYSPISYFKSESLHNSINFSPWLFTILSLLILSSRFSFIKYKYDESLSKKKFVMFIIHFKI